jgi:hypothetical protein
MLLAIRKIEKFSCLHVVRMSFHRVQISLLLVLILSCRNSVQIITNYTFNIYVNSFLPSISKFSRWSFSGLFRVKFRMHFQSQLFVFNLPHSSSFLFYCRNNIRRGVQIIKLPFMLSFLLLLVVPWAKYSPQHIVLKQSQLARVSRA